MAYVIRPFHSSDAEALAELTQAAIRTIGARAYSDEQVDAWAARHPDGKRFVERAKAGSQIWVAADSEDHAVAFALLDLNENGDGHLDMLYCHPEHSRRSLADQLLAEVERQARQEGAQRLYTEASELARPAFERAGYSVQRRRDFEIEGVRIHNYAMEKRLD